MSGQEGMRSVAIGQESSEQGGEGGDRAGGVLAQPRTASGSITSLIHVVIFFLPPIYLMVFYGLPADWGTIMQGAAATWSFSMPLWFIEPISYFLVLGVCGTYISFLAGNISNFRLPVSAVAQEWRRSRKALLKAKSSPRSPSRQPR